MAKTVYFHLRWRNPDKPIKERDISVVAISENQSGPYYLFEIGDRPTLKHKFFRTIFDKKKEAQKPFKNVCTVKQVLSGIILNEYWNDQAARFEFNGLPLALGQIAGSSYGCK